MKMQWCGLCHVARRLPRVNLILQVDNDGEPASDVCSERVSTVCESGRASEQVVHGLCLAVRVRVWVGLEIVRVVAI